MAEKYQRARDGFVAFQVTIGECWCWIERELLDDPNKVIDTVADLIKLRVKEFRNEKVKSKKDKGSDTEGVCRAPYPIPEEYVSQGESCIPPDSEQV